MKAKVICKEESVIYKGNIYTHGDEFEVDETIGKSLIERGYIAGITDNADLFDEEEVCDLNAELEAMSYPQLKAYASELGVSAKGTKDELIERILKYMAEVEETEAEEVEEEAEADFEESEDEAEEAGELPNTSMPE